jgi:hypothetical protein
MQEHFTTHPAVEPSLASMRKVYNSMKGDTATLFSRFEASERDGPPLGLEPHPSPGHGVASCVQG